MVSHPDDYRALHRTLLLDFYADLMRQYGRYGSAARLWAELDASAVANLAALRSRVQQARDQWTAL